MTDIPRRGNIPCVTTAQHNSAPGVPADPRYAMARPASTHPDGRLLDNILAMVKRERMVSGVDESKKTIDFKPPEELKVSHVTFIITTFLYLPPV